MVYSLDSKKEANSNNRIIAGTETSCCAVQKNTAYSPKNSFENINPLSISAAENSHISASHDSNLCMYEFIIIYIYIYISFYYNNVSEMKKNQIII